MLDPRLGDNLIHRVNVGDSLTRITARRPDAVAVVDGAHRYTYRELNAWVNRVANTLNGWGLRARQPRLAAH
jgi:non-ribosomal peptide synthetase component E (peptide arylation enzyme)